MTNGEESPPPPPILRIAALEAREEGGERETLEDRQPAGPQWVDTPSSRQVIAALGYAQREGDIAVIHGGTGVGKTAAARRYARLGEEVWIAVMSPSANRLRPCLQQVAYACDLPYLAGGAYRMEIELAARLYGTRGLLVIDEAQHLGQPQLDSLRGLYDETGCGLALLGNDRFGRRISCAPEFAALASRVGARLHLPAATAGDVDALLDAWGIGGATARKEARRERHDEGPPAIRVSQDPHRQEAAVR